MRRTKHLLMAVVSTILLHASPVVHAAVITLSPQANGDIRGGSPDTAFSRAYLAVINDNGTVGGAGKAYVRFQLPADFGTATDATFTIYRYGTSVYNLGHAVLGLNDGVTGEATWTEADTSSPGPTDLTWNNAPGNDATSTSDFVNATSLGSFTTTGSNNGGSAGDSYTVSGAALVSFLNADTNGLVTLMINQSASDVTSSEDLFASDSNGGSFGVASLQLTYTPAPEPTSSAVIGAAVPLLLHSRRRQGR